MTEEQVVILSITKVAGKEFRKLAVFIPAPFREGPTINLLNNLT
jgi:hypothetical protein